MRGVEYVKKVIGYEFFFIYLRKIRFINIIVYEVFELVIFGFLCGCLGF